MTAFVVAPSVEPIKQVLTADEYDALPVDPLCELVDGVIHMVATPTPWHQDVADALRAALVRLAPGQFRVTRRVEVRLSDLHRRNPDVLVVRAEGFDRLIPFLRPDQVVLVVEVISPGSESADPLVKAIEYARAGIPHYWRVETRDLHSVDVHTYRLVDESGFTPTGTFGGAETIIAPGLEWATVDMAELTDED